MTTTVDFDAATYFAMRDHECGTCGHTAYHHGESVTLHACWISGCDCDNLT